MTAKLTAMGEAFRCAAVALLVLATAPSAHAQSTKQPFRIGFLANTTSLSELERGARSDPAVVAFVDGLADLGWHDGRNIRIVWRSAEGQYDRLQQLADELARVPVDVIVAFGVGVPAAARATKTIPIVMAAHYSPIESGLAKTFARPGRNVTGLTLVAGVDKQLELLKAISPSVSRVAVVFQWQGAGVDRRRSEVLRHAPLVATAAALDLALFAESFADLGELKAAITSAARQGAQGILLQDQPYLHYPEYQQIIAQEAGRHRIPVLFPVLAAASNGGLMAYGTDITLNFRRAPYFVDRILKGAKPADIPIEQPIRVEFHVNQRAAKEMGLEISSSVLLRADKVFQ